MLVFNVIFRCFPGKREEFLQRIKAGGIDEACRAEEGTLGYEYYLSADHPDDLLLVEKWRDMEAVRAHARQPHMAGMDAFKPEYVADLILEAYGKDR